MKSERNPSGMLTGTEVILHIAMAGSVLGGVVYGIELPVSVTRKYARNSINLKRSGR